MTTDPGFWLSRVHPDDRDRLVTHWRADRVRSGERSDAIEYRMIDRSGSVLRDERGIQGDAADLEVLERAGIARAPAAVITTHDDDTNVFLTLYCRRLRPEMQIVSRATYEKNVMAAGRLIHRLTPGMRDRGWGRIIQIGSMAGTVPTSAQPDYAAAKAAMLAMSLGLSKALKGTGVTVNTVTPGLIWTEGLQQFLADFAAKRGWDDIDQAADYILKGTGQTVLRIGQPEDVANAVAYLASPIADFVNGVNIHMDGGGTANIY